MNNYSQRKYLLIGFAISSVILSTTVFFYYRSYLIDKSLIKFSTTGKFDQESLINANKLGSAYSIALLAFSNKFENDSVKAKETLNSVLNSTDWKVIALSNLILEKSKETQFVHQEIDKKSKNGDWFWTYFKSLCINKGINGYSRNYSLFSSTNKKAADLGCVYSMITQAFITQDCNEKLKYLRKVNINEIQNKIIVGEYYSEMASIFKSSENGCFKDEKLYFDYSNKASKLGDPRGYFLLGQAYHKGLGIRTDLDKAIENYSKAIDLGYDTISSGEATINLVSIYKDGLSASVKKSRNREIIFLAGIGTGDK